MRQVSIFTSIYKFRWPVLSDGVDRVRLCCVNITYKHLFCLQVAYQLNQHVQKNIKIRFNLRVPFFSNFNVFNLPSGIQTLRCAYE